MIDQSKGTPSRDHISWVNTKRFRKPEDFDQQLLAEFLLGTPAVDVSAQSAGFIQRFKCNSSDDAEALFIAMTEGVDVMKVDTANELALELRATDRLEGGFWETGEFAVFVTGNTSAKVADEFAKTTIDPSSAIFDTKSRLIKRKIAQLDAFFRHIRNALAHGSFNSFATESGQVYAFQDANPAGYISARICLSEKRLKSIITTIHRCEIEGI